jgi:YesN/AraC family two-component response regulator
MAEDRGRSILLVDDDESVLETYCELLALSGFDPVYRAGDGLEALEVFRQSKVDLLITDINMPRMGGIELISKVRERDKNLPILVISGYLKEEHLPVLEPFKVAGTFFKPFRVTDLITRMWELLEERTA